MARLAIFYYCYFLLNDDEARWKEHCQNMSLGTEPNLMAQGNIG
jgi:hypothetical protein